MKRIAALLVAVAVASVATNPRPSSAQNLGPIVSDTSGCTYDSRRSLCPGVWLGSAGAAIAGLTATQDGVTLTVRGGFDASFDVGVSDTSVEGSWSMDGDWTMDAEGQGVGGRAEVAASLTGSIAGTPARLEVSGQFSNAGTFNFGPSSQPINNTHPLSGLVITVDGGTCVDAVGTWEVSWADLASDAGWSGTETITGDFHALRQEGIELSDTVELSDRFVGGQISAEEIEAASLSEGMREALLALNEYDQVVDRIRDEDLQATDALVNAMLDAGDRLDAALNALANDFACEPALNADVIQKFRRTVTNIMIETVKYAGSGDAQQLSGETLRRLGLRAIATGAMGPASTHDSLDVVNEAFGNAVSATLEARTQLGPGPVVAFPKEQQTFDTVSLLRTIVETGVILNVHDLGQRVFSNDDWVNQFERNVVLQSTPSVTPAPASDEGE